MRDFRLNRYTRKCYATPLGVKIKGDYSFEETIASFDFEPTINDVMSFLNLETHIIGSGECKSINVYIIEEYDENYKIYDNINFCNGIEISDKTISECEIIDDDTIKKEFRLNRYTALAYNTRRGVEIPGDQFFEETITVFDFDPKNEDIYKHINLKKVLIPKDHNEWINIYRIDIYVNEEMIFDNGNEIYDTIIEEGDDNEEGDEDEE